MPFDSLQSIATILGLGFLSGIRLYATVLAIGAIIRLHLFTLPASVSHLSVFANKWVMIAAGVGCLAEFCADKVPWFDSAWDTFHTIIRPIGAAVIGAQAFGSADPATRTLIALATGTVALAGHSSKAATRVVVNHSPEPFTNIALSFFEDLFVPFGIWLTFAHPLITTIGVIVALVVIVFLMRKIVRLLRRLWGGREQAATPIAQPSAPRPA